MASKFIDLGLSRLLAVGSNVRVLRFIRRCTGLEPTCCVGVFRWSSSARSMSLLDFLHFRSICLAFLTADSTLPLAWLLYGLIVRCSKSHVLEKVANSSDEYCGPLSETNCSGIPYRAKCFFILFITLVDLVLDSLSSS